MNQAPWTIFPLLLAVVPLRAGVPQIEIPDWDNAVRLRLVASQDALRPGDTAQLAVLIDIQSGYHLYGPEEKPPSRTEIEVEGKSLQSKRPLFPPVVRRDLSGLGEFDLYEGSLAIRIPIVLSPQAGTGSEVEARVRIKHQICTDQACSAPRSTKLSIVLPVREKGSPVQELHPDVFKSDPRR